jgi:hypothetical protein
MTSDGWTGHDDASVGGATATESGAADGDVANRAASVIGIGIVIVTGSARHVVADDGGRQPKRSTACCACPCGGCSVVPRRVGFSQRLHPQRPAGWRCRLDRRLCVSGLDGQTVQTRLRMRIAPPPDQVVGSQKVADLPGSTSDKPSPSGASEHPGHLRHASCLHELLSIPADDTLVELAREQPVASRRRAPHGAIPRFAVLLAASSAKPCRMIHCAANSLLLTSARPPRLMSSLSPRPAPHP